MADVIVNGINYDDGSSALLSIYGNDVAEFSGGVWNGKHQNLTPGHHHISYVRNYAYIFSLLDAPISRNSSGTYSTSTNLNNAPRGMYSREFGDTILVSNIQINSDNFQRRSWYSNIIVDEDNVSWGLEYGSDLSQTADSKIVTSSSATFLQSEMRVGDDFIIKDGSNAGSYAIVEVISDTQVLLDRVMQYTSSSNKYIAGSNWFDIDGTITGQGEHYGVALVFSQNKAWRWSKSIGKKPVYGVGGTSSYKSVVSEHQGMTFWFNPSDGIVMFNGSTAVSVTDKIKDVVDAISDPTAVVGWPGVGLYKNHVYFYVGDLSFDDYSLTDVIIDYNIARNTIRLHEYNTTVVSATKYIESNQEVVYLGTDSNVVLKFSDGRTDYDVANDDGSTLDISWYIESHPFYPSGPEILNEMESIYAYTNGSVGHAIQTKLHGVNDLDDTSWSTAFETTNKYSEIGIDPHFSPARGLSWKIKDFGTTKISFKGITFVYGPSSEVRHD